MHAIINQIYNYYLHRAGELDAKDIDKIAEVIATPEKYSIPLWMLNRRKDPRTGKDSQEVANALDMKLREDLEGLKKIKCERGLRHIWGIRVRGQHTKTTGRRGKSMGSGGKKKVCVDAKKFVVLKCLLTLFLFILDSLHKRNYNKTIFHKNPKIFGFPALLLQSPLFIHCIQF